MSSSYHFAFQLAVITSLLFGFAAVVGLSQLRRSRSSRRRWESD